MILSDRLPTGKSANNIATEIIGRGAYSIVYKAVHNDLKMVVAIKMMRHNMVVDSGFLLNFRKEAQIIASLNHESILKVYDFEERYKTVFIVTEFLEGESLRKLLVRLGKIPQQLAIQYIRQICSGLAYAHEKGIIHRDIHADNIMVLPNNRIKILDFGLACPVGTEDEQIGGALAYQAPELLEGGWADRRSDIYALGITVFELITGKIPFTTHEKMDIFQRNSKRIIPAPSHCMPDIYPELARFIVKACHHEREKRYQDIPEALGDLAPLLNHHFAAIFIKDAFIDFSLVMGSTIGVFVIQLKVIGETTSKISRIPCWTIILKSKSSKTRVTHRSAEYLARSATSLREVHRQKQYDCYHRGSFICRVKP